MERVDWEHPDLQRLVAAQEAELRERYAGQVVDDEIAPETVTAAVLLREGEEAVACGILRDPAPSFSAGTGELNRMYVVPESRRQGLSRVVLRELEAIAVERRLQQLVLEVAILQPEAIGLYTSEGYRIIDNYPPYDESEDARCFAKAF